MLFILMILSSLTSSIGILLIIPLLSSIGIHLNDNSSITDANSWISDFFTSIALEPSLLTVLVIYLLVIFTVAALNYLNTMMSAKLRMQFVDGLRNKIFKSLFYAQWQFLTHQRLSDFARMVTNQVQSTGYPVQQLMSLASRLVLILIYLGMSLLLSLKLTLLALVAGLILIAALLPLNKYIHQSGRLELKSYSNIFHSVFEQLSSMKVIKSYSAEQQYLKQMSSASKTLETQQIKLARYNALSRLVSLCGAAVIFAFLFYISISSIGLPISNLILILFIFSRLMPQLSAVQTSIQQLIHAAPEYVDLIEKNSHLEAYQENDIGRSENLASIAPPFKSQLILKEIGHTYPEKTTPVFSGLNVQIQKNQTIAICGASGAGKSTLADIIAGLTIQHRGQFLVDGVEIDKTNHIAWRTKVAYVTQDVFLFNDSIRANLSWVVTKPPSDTQLWECLKMAAADEFIRALPKGLDTGIGDRGVQLSGGEKQRIALARALITEPEILILDEATSALDKENEEKIQEAIATLNKKLTIIVIAHDQSRIEHISQRIYL